MIFFTRYEVYSNDIYGTLRLSVHLPSGWMTMKNSNRFDRTFDDADDVEEEVEKKINPGCNIVEF